MVNLELKESFQKLNRKLCLECKIEANPIEKIIWYKNGTIMDLKLDEKKNFDLNSNFTYLTNFKHTKYEVTSENHFFKFLSTFTIRVKVKI